MTLRVELSETAYAKINLALHVRYRRLDGYHDLDTIFAFLDDGDQLRVRHNEQLSLTIAGPFANGLTSRQDNLVMHTAMLMQNRYNIKHGAALHLEKRLPIASGIGGGSADAAATARMLNKHWQIHASENELAALLAPLGADIPACVSSRMARGLGTGTDLLEISPNPLSGHSILLVNPMQQVSTAAVFAAWDQQDRGALNGPDMLEMIQSGRNDLLDTALILCPDIGIILSALQRFSPLLSRMSGSGATCFAIFDDQEECETVQNYFRAEHQTYWTMAGKIR